jgi:hypothetical protein
VECSIGTQILDEEQISLLLFVLLLIVTGTTDACGRVGNAEHMAVLATDTLIGQHDIADFLLTTQEHIVVVQIHMVVVAIDRNQATPCSVWW